MAEPEIREIASIERDPYVSQWTGTLQPQDETLRQKAGGKGVGLYDEIRRDPHAFSVLQKRSLEVSSREWAVFPASERRIDKQAAALVEAQLKGLNLDRLTLGMMSAILKGYSVGEVIWELRGGVWWAAKVKVRKHRRFRFTIGGELRLLTRDSGFDGEALPDRKFIVHRYSIDQDDDDPYGLGLGTVLFWPAWFKRQVLAHWLQANERHASPTVKAQYQGSYDEARQKQILGAIRTMARDAGLVVPESVEVELMESGRGGGGDLHEKLARYLDELMSEAVLGETLSTNSGERGARSLGEIHNEVRIAIAKADADLLSATFKESLVRWIVEVNMPGAGVPDVWRDFSEAEDLDDRAARDKIIFDMGFEPKDPEYINETYGGEWVKKVAPAPVTPADPAQAMDRTAALFADPEPRDDDPSAPLVDQLDELATPAIDAMVERLRQAAIASSGFDEFAERLLALSGEIDPSDLARILEDAMIVADLTGRSEVADGR
jgi:phage gp29-like protein